MQQVITSKDAQSADESAEQAEAAQVAAEAAFASVDEPQGAVKSVEKPEPVEEKTEAEKSEAEKSAESKEAQEAAAKAAAEAEWEGVPVKVRQTLEAISGKVGTLDKIEHRLKGVEGRSGAALEGVHALKTALETAQTVKKEGGEAPTQAQIAAAVASDESWGKLKEDFPEWAEGTDKRIDQRVEERLSKLPPAVDAAGLKSELTGSMSEIIAKATSDAKAEARELSKIDRKYETWPQDIFINGADSFGGFTPDFAKWEAAQPPEIRALKTSGKAADAIKMLDGFYEHRKALAEATAKEARNKKRLDSAITPKGVVTAQINRTPSEREAMEQAFASVDDT